MRRLFLLLCVLVGVSLPVSAMERYFNYCNKGGFNVVTQGLTSDSTFQRSFKSCTVEIFTAGTINHPAQIYSDNNSPGSPTSLANPFTSNSDGYFEFYAPAGRYDVKITAISPPEKNLSSPYTFTWGDVLLCDPLGPRADVGCSPGGGGVGSHNLLSNTHLDTMPYSPPVRGDIVTAQNLISPSSVTPAWARLGLVPSSPILTNNGVDVLWGTLASVGGCPLAGPCPINVYNNGTLVGIEPNLNMIAGTNVTLSPFTDSGGKINLTINSTTGVSSVTLNMPAVEFTPASQTGAVLNVYKGNIAPNLIASGPATPGVANITNVGINSCSSCSSISTAYPNQLTPGSALVAFVAHNTNMVGGVISDTLGNTWNHSITAGNTLNENFSMHYACNTAGGADTVSISGSTVESTMAVNVIEIKNAAAACFPSDDGFSTNSFPPLSITTSLPVSSSTKVVLMGYDSQGGITGTLSGIGDSKIAETVTGGISMFTQVQDAASGLSGTQTMTATNPMSDNVRMEIFSIALNSAPNGTAPWTFRRMVPADTYWGLSKCASALSPAVCGVNAIGNVVIAAGSTTVVVDTTAIISNNQILLSEDSSVGTLLGVTCNTTTGRSYSVSARTSQVSFTVTASAAPATNPACLTYFIPN